VTECAPETYNNQWCTNHDRQFLEVGDETCTVDVHHFTRPQKDYGWLLVAEAVAARADCRRRQVGAVIVDKYDRIVSTGRNGSPPGGPSCLAGECPRGLLTKDQLPPDSSYDSGIGKCVAVHAEANALIFGDPDRMRGGTMYVTEKPCLGCQRQIEGMGLNVIFNSKESNEHR
jgi:dCMP deaminase